MISKWVGYYNLLINGISWSYNFITHLLTIDPNFRAHPNCFLFRQLPTWRIIPRLGYVGYVTIGIVGTSPKDDPPRLRRRETGTGLGGFWGIFGKSRNPAENTPPPLKIPLNLQGVYTYIYIYISDVYTSMFFYIHVIYFVSKIWCYFATCAVCSCSGNVPVKAVPAFVLLWKHSPFCSFQPNTRLIWSPTAELSPP